MGKSIFASKTFYANLLALVATIATTSGFDLGLTAEVQATIIAGVMSIVNIVLRFVTTEPIKKGG